VGAFARAVTIEPDGKLLASGMASVGSLVSVRIHPALARYGADGRLDPGFGDGGRIVATEWFGSNYAAPALARQPDGKVIVAGDAVAADSIVFRLARYLPDGRIDATFGDGGITTTIVTFGLDPPTKPGFVEGGAFALALQRDGRLVAAGAAPAIHGAAVFALVRYLPDGNLDHTFGTGGTVTTDFGAGSVAFAVALQPDGKIVAAGTDGNARFAVARYLRDGRLDPAFGVDGKVITAFGSQGVLAVALQPDGKLIAVGTADLGDRDAFALARYLADGRLDPSFGDGGTTTIEFGRQALRTAD
jgi:uncharacterized delta-60 repeat protein